MALNMVIYCARILNVIYVSGVQHYKLTSAYITKRSLCSYKSGTIHHCAVDPLHLFPLCKDVLMYVCTLSVLTIPPFSPPAGVCVCVCVLRGSGEWDEHLLSC